MSVVGSLAKAHQKSGAWMKFAVNFAQAGSGDMSVNLGGTDIGMPQQLLDHPEVSAVFEKVRGEAMAQHVWGDVPGNAGSPHPLFDPEPQRDGGEWCAAFGKE